MKTQMHNCRLLFAVLTVAYFALTSSMMVSDAHAQWVSVGQVQGISIWRNTRTNLEWTTSLSSVNGNAQARNRAASLGFRLPTFDELADVVNNNGGVNRLNIRTGLLDYYETADSNVLAGAFGGNIRTRLDRNRPGTHYVVGVRRSNSQPVPPQPQQGIAPIVEIKIQASINEQIAKQPISGFYRVDMDLNRGMGSGTDYIYLFYRRSWNERPITGLEIIVGERTNPSAGFDKINVNLNKGTNADRIYLCYTRNPYLRPVTDITVLHQDRRPSTSGYQMIDVNLNRGGGRRGDNLFLWYKRN